MRDVRLLVSELVTNAVRHAELAATAIRLVVAARRQTLRVEVHDPGSGFELEPPPTTRRAGRAGGSYLVAQLADRWGVDRSPCTRVWFELD